MMMSPPVLTQFPAVAEDVSFTVPLSVHIEFITKVCLEPHLLHEEVDEEEDEGGRGGEGSSDTNVRYLLTSFSSSTSGDGDPSFSSSTPAVATEAVFVPASWLNGDWHLCVSEHINAIRPPTTTRATPPRTNPTPSSIRSSKYGEYFPSGFLFTTTTDDTAMDTHHRNGRYTSHFRHACRVAVDTRTVSVESINKRKGGVSIKTYFQLSTLQVPPEASVLLVGDVVPLHPTDSDTAPSSSSSTTRHRGRPPSFIPPSLTTNLRPESWMLPLSLRQQLVLLKLSAVHSDWLFPHTTSTNEDDDDELANPNNHHFNYNNTIGIVSRPFLSRKPLASTPIMTPPSTSLHAMIQRYEEGLHNEDDAAMVIFNPALLSGLNLTTTGRFGLGDAAVSAIEEDEWKRSRNTNNNSDDDADVRSVAYHQAVLGNIAAVVDAFGAVISTKLQIGRTDVVIAARADPTTVSMPKRSAIPLKNRCSTTSLPITAQQPYHEFTTTTSKMTALRALVISNLKAANTKTRTATAKRKKAAISSLDDVSNTSPLPQVESVWWLQQCARDLLVFGPSCATTKTTPGVEHDGDGVGIHNNISPRFVPARVAFSESLKARWWSHINTINKNANPSNQEKTMKTSTSNTIHDSTSSSSLAALSIPHGVRILLEGNLWSSLHDQKVDEEIRSLHIDESGGGGDTPLRPMAVGEEGSVMATPGCSTPGSYIPYFASPPSAPSPGNNAQSPQYRQAVPTEENTSCTPRVTPGGGESLKRGGMSPKVSTFTVNAGLLQSLLTSYYKTTQGNASPSTKMTNGGAEKRGDRVVLDGKSPSEVTVLRSDTLHHYRSAAAKDVGDAMSTIKQPSTLPAVRPPATEVTIEDVDSQGLVERQLFDKEGVKETSSSPNARTTAASTSPNYLLEVSHAGKEEDSSNASSTSSSGSSIFADPSRPRSAHRVANDRRKSLLAQSTTRMLSAMGRSLSLSPHGGGRTSSKRDSTSANVGGKRQREDDVDDCGEDCRSSGASPHTSISICSPTDNDASAATSRSTLPGVDSGMQSPQRAEGEEYDEQGGDANHRCNSIRSPSCRYPPHRQHPHLCCSQDSDQHQHQQPPTAVKRRVCVGGACSISTGEDDSLRVGKRNLHRHSELSINAEDDAATTLMNLTDKNVATVNMNGNAVHIGGMPLDAIYCRAAAPKRSVRLTLLK